MTSSPLTAEEIKGAVLRFPSLPNIVSELINELDKKDVDRNILAQKISHDQGLTAKVLGLANSSFYGMQSKVSSITHAITVLGFNSVRSLVTAAAITDRFSGGLKSEFNYAEFWKHAIGTALCTKIIARHVNANQDEAFIAGLLHNIGRLVLLTYAPARYGEVMRRCAQGEEDLVQAEIQIFGVTHKAVGRTILEHWKFPESIVATLAEPEESASPERRRIAAATIIADAIVYGLDLSDGEHDRVPIISQLAWETLSLDDATLLEIFEATEAQFGDVCAILRTTRKA